MKLKRRHRRALSNLARRYDAFTDAHDLAKGVRSNDQWEALLDLMVASAVVLDAFEVPGKGWP